MADGLDPALIAARVLGALGGAGFRAALGGALALGLWSIPRGTKDVDVNVFTPLPRHPDVLRVLESLGCTPRSSPDAWSESDRATFLERAREGDAAIAFLEGFRIDVFFSSIPFHDEAERTLREVPFEGQRVLALSPESVAVFKLLFFRDKDLVDLAALVSSQGTNLDVGYVRREIVGMVGETDERVAAWDRIVRTHGA